MTRVERRTIRSVRVDLGDGRVVKACRFPSEVLIHVSGPAAPPGGRVEDTLSLPADAAPALREALAALEGIENGG